MLIPMFNECRNAGAAAFTDRLLYFNSLASSCCNEVDVILIDDGSTDDSLPVAKRVLQDARPNLHMLSVLANTNKVGALYKAASLLDHEFVVTSDFDTDLINVQSIYAVLDRISCDDKCMGCYFQLLPYRTGDMLVDYQVLDYCSARAWYAYFQRQGSVPVMPGAGSLYKRRALLRVLAEHSGRRSGEDRESTAIGLRLGYMCFYYPAVRAVTRTPRNLADIRQQRRRWNRGYIETFIREADFYFHEVTRWSRLGQRTAADVTGFAALILMPLVATSLAAISLRLCIVLCAIWYAVSLAGVLVSMLRPAAWPDVWQSLRVVPLYPFIYVAVELPAWLAALRDVYLASKKGRRSTSTGAAVQ